MTAFPPRVLPVVAFTAWCLVRAAGAQETAPVAAAPAMAPVASAPFDDSAAPSVARVEVTALREPIEFPYERAYAAVAKVREASGGTADLVFKLADRQPVTAPLRVSLQYGETVEPLVVDASKGFTLMPNPIALAQHAILTANRPRHGVSVDVSIRPHVDAGAVLTRAEIDRLVDGAKAARKALLPWYARVVLPTIRAVRLCSLDDGARFALRDPAGVDHPLPTRDDDDLHDRHAHCAEVGPTDDDSEKPMSLVMPPDSTVDYAVSGF